MASLPSFAQTFSLPVNTSLRLPPLTTDDSLRNDDSRNKRVRDVQIKQEHDDGAPPPSTTRPSPPSKRRRVTISGGPHPLNTDLRPTPDQTNSTPISPVVMGFTITRDNPTAIEKVKNMISVKQKQKALIEQRRGSIISPTTPQPDPKLPIKRRSPNNHHHHQRRPTHTSPRQPSPPPPSCPPPPSTSNPSHSLPPPPISFARRRAEQLGSTAKKKPADILISPREAQTHDQLQPAVQSAPPIPHAAGQSPYLSGRFPMVLPRLPSAMGGGDNVRRVATAVPPTPTRLAMQRNPTLPPPPPTASTSQRSPPAASVPIASTLVPPTPGLFHHPGYAGDKAAFLAPFEVFYDALNDSKQLKSWLSEQLARSNTMIQALTQQQEKLNELVDTLVDKQVAPIRTEMLGLQRRVEELEDALKAASAGRPQQQHRRQRNGLPGTASPMPMPIESYTFPPAPLEPSLSSRRHPHQSSPPWSQNQHDTPMDVEMTDSPKPLHVDPPSRRVLESSRSLPLEPPPLPTQRLSPRAPFDSPKPPHISKPLPGERPSLSRHASTHSVGGPDRERDKEGAQQVQSPPTRRGSVIMSPPDAPPVEDN